MFPEAADVRAAAAEGANVGLATPDGQCLSDVVKLSYFQQLYEALPVIVVGLTHTTRSCRYSVDGCLSCGCSGRLSDASWAVPVLGSIKFSCL